MIRLAINGYGRIGGIAHRIIIERFSDQINVVGINAGESTDIKGWMYLLKYDSTYGKLQNHTLNFQLPPASPSEAGRAISNFQTNPNEQNPNIQNREDYIGSLIIDEKNIPVFSQRDPSLLPWRDLNVDVVIESTGVFEKEEELKLHLQAGAKSVVLSAPFKPARNASQPASQAERGGLGASVAGGDEGNGSTYVLGVNLTENDGQNPGNIISNASCTTNCIAPVAKIIEDNFGIEKAMMTTIHAFTSDQRLQDGGHKDYRRARAASQNIIPTSTGATEAAAKAIPALVGKFNGLAIRVPVITGSLADFTFLIKRETTKDEVNEIFKKSAEEERYKNILKVTDDPIVSSDIIGEIYSSIVDLSLTQVVGGNMLKVIAWYDNEYGYTNRLVEEAVILGKKAAAS